MSDNWKNGWRTLILGILFILAFPAYLFLPKIIGSFITIGQDDIEVFKHFLLTIAAIIGVHLIDLFKLRKDTAREYKDLTENISKNLREHVDKQLERYNEDTKEEKRLSRTRNDSLNKFYQTSLNTTQEKLKGLIETIGSLNERVEYLEGLLTRIDYLKVGDDVDEGKVTEVTIFQRAIAEVSKACESIDVFTSYLLEADDKIEDNMKARNDYFELLLNLCKNNQIKEYRRIVQVQRHDYLEKIFEGKAASYLNHIKKMEQMEHNNKKVHPRVLIQRRPTTYVIIDKKVLLWQINQIAKESQMQMYAMFIVEDSANILIKYFIKEFDDYYHGNLTEHPKLKFPIRS